jgi:hypothetical protein
VDAWCGWDVYWRREDDRGSGGAIKPRDQDPIFLIWSIKMDDVTRISTGEKCMEAKSGKWEGGGNRNENK